MSVTVDATRDRQDTQPPRPAGSLRRAGDWVADRLGLRLDQAVDHEATLPRLQIALDLDRAGLARVAGVDHVREHVEDSLAGLGVLAAEDGLDRSAVRVARLLVDDQQRLAPAAVDRARPSEQAGESDADEVGLAEPAALDQVADGGAAVALGR